MAALAFSTLAVGQCTNTSSYASAVAAPVGGSVTFAPGCSFAGEYSTLTGITAGYQYTFAINGPATFITVHQGTSNGPVIGFGTSPLTVLTAAATTLYPHWNVDAACGAATSCLATTVMTNGPPPVPCSGTPAPGNTLSSAASACAGQNITLSLQNLTPGNDVLYQWYTGAGPIGVAMSATLVTSQTAATDYYCLVTCGANTVASNTLSIGMNTTPASPEDFSSSVFPPGCWSDNDPTGFLERSGVSAYGVGVGSAFFDFYNASSGEFSLISPVLAPVPVGYQVRFDVAGATYPGSIDVIRLEGSSDGGATWSLIQEMTNAEAVGELNTAGALTSLFLSPTAGQWRTLTFGLTPGTDRIRFRGISDFGNQVYLDNIVIEPLPACETPTGVSSTLNSTTEAVIAWILGSATSYNIEIRTSGLAGSGPAGLAVSANGETGPIYIATLAPNTTYFVYIQADCAGTLSAWSSAHSFFSGYCAAGATSTAFEKIANVTIGNINNTSTSTAGYEDFTGMVINMEAGVATPFSVDLSEAYTSDQVIIWVDLNNDVIFTDPVERLFISDLPLSNDPLPGTITLPAGTPPGNYRMRIRLHDTSFNGNATPCGNSNWGQVEDYTISICSPPVASYSVLDDCGAGTFDVDVNISSLGSGASAAIQYTINDGAPVSVAANLGSNLLGLSGLTSTSDAVLLKVGNGTACSLNLGEAFSSCPVQLDCSAPAIPQTHCYANNDPRTFHYIAEPGETVTINFISGDIDLADAVNFYDGPNNLSPALGGGNFFGDLASADFTSTQEHLFVEIISDGSNSCFDGGQANKWQWTVQCTADCTPPFGIVEYTSPASTCNPPEFYLNVLVFDAGAEFGGGVNPLSTVDVKWTINGGSPGMVSGVGVFVPTQIGPFPLGSDVNVVLGHATNSLCDANLGIFRQANNCPPANDECTNAQQLVIAGINGCPAGAVQGTTAFATSSVGTSVPAPTCNTSTGVLQDVWYSFNTGSVANLMRFNFGGGTATDFGVALYNAGVSPAPGCVGSLIGCLANSPLGINFTGFPTNTNYYLRVFTYSGSGDPGTFTICVNGSSCAPPTAITATGITESSATIGWTGPAGNYIVEYGPASSFTTPGTGATAGPGGTIMTFTGSPASLSGLAGNTQYRVAVRRDCGGADGFSFNLVGLFSTLPPPPPPVDFDAGVTCNAQPPLPIPDNGCGSNNALIANLNGLNIPGNTLGVNVSVESVDIIVTHSWRGDLEISLISPSGQSRSLIAQRGGSSNDFGDIITCTPLKLKDGGASLATLPFGTGGTGTYAPEAALSSFTGLATGQWQLRICDAFDFDSGQLEYAQVNFVPCAGPTFSTSLVQNCGAFQYSVNVNITNMGSASSYAIGNNVNGSIVTASGVGTYTVGPFTSGVPATLSLAHNGNALCNGTAGPFVSYCPPLNDLCSNAIPISCNQVIAGYTIAATTTGAPGFCGTSLNTAGGVWYTVQGWNGPMTASMCTGTSYDSKIGVFTGSCPAPTSCNTTCAALPPGVVDCSHPAYAQTIAADSYCCNVDFDDICQDIYNAFGGPVVGGSGLTCVVGIDDACGLQSEVTWMASAGTTYYIYVTGFGGSTGAFNLSVQCGTTSEVCSANGLRLEVQTDAAPGETTWEILNEAGNLVVVGGGPYANANSSIIASACLPNGCYRLRVLDSAGDGMISGPYVGGYVLRTASTNARIIDNHYNFDGIYDGSASAIGSGLGFCLPIGSDALKAASCDQVNWVVGAPIQAVTNPAVSAQWLVGDQTASGYEFWVFDPNGSYSHRVYHSHAVTLGFGPPSAVRATQVLVNNFTGIPWNRLLNIRVRSRVQGVNAEWGPACRMLINPNSVACPPTSLETASGNQFSCGVQRTTSQSVWAKNVPGANQYEFRFRYAPEGIVFVRTSASRQLPLNWTGADALQVGITYTVEVRARKGLEWCVRGPVWGPFCTVQIIAPTVNGGANSLATQGNGTFSMYPNPNNGQQLYMSITELPVGVTTVSVDILSMSGQRVTARTIAAQDGFVNTVLDLNGDIAAGMYVVSITAGDRAYTERLVIQP